ncbi:MAG: type II toxin-antitoxin system VapC family toxin [Lachnospiraceae bacterium]|nr:type II toxin-antitoxin system VapC family toxin [Lachnospiraceae bacterium]
MYMLDTNIIIFSIRHPDSQCARKIAEHTGIDLCISVVTFAELEYGIRNSKYPAQNRAALQMFLAGIKILDFTMHAAVHFGDILADMHQKKILRENSDRDKMIAAHARSLGYTLVTNNTKDFICIQGLRLEDWRVPGDL